MRLTRALVLLTAGLVGVFVVYSMRPPSGFMDALSMMSQGQSHFIRSPLYQLLLGVCGLVAVLGAVGVVKSLTPSQGTRA